MTFKADLRLDFLARYADRLPATDTSPKSPSRSIPFLSFPFSLGGCVDDSLLNSKEIKPLFRKKTGKAPFRRSYSAPPKLTPSVKPVPLKTNSLDESASESERPIKKRTLSQTDLADSTPDQKPKEEIGQTIAIPSPRHSAPAPLALEETCQELIDRIGETVHQTVSEMDFDGLKPFLKLFDQIEQGKSPPECAIDCSNEALGSTCVGMSHKILKNIKEKHGIEGALAVERPNSSSYCFGHASVIIPCKDGYVMLDPRSNPDYRIFSVPYGSTSQSKTYVLTAGKKGASPALILKNQIAGKEESFEYFIDVANGDDIVAKSYMIKSIEKMIPIAVYKPDGSPLKSIKIIPSESSIIFKDHVSEKEKTINYEWVGDPSFLVNLEAFMGSDFHMPIQTVYKEIVSFVSQESKLARAFDFKKAEQESPWS